MKMLLSCLLGLAGAVAAQPELQIPVSFGRVPTVVSGEPGKVVTAEVEVKIAPPYHIYGLEAVGGETETEFDLEGTGASITGKVKPSRPAKVHKDEYVSYAYWEEDVVFSLSFRIAGDAAPGRQPMKLIMRYMACTDEMCLPASSLTAPLSVEVLQRTGPAATSDAEPVFVDRVSVPARVEGGREFSAEVKVSIESPYRIFGLEGPEGEATALSVEGSDRLEIAGPITADRAPKTEGTSPPFWEKQVVLRVPLRVKGDEPAKELQARLVLHFTARAGTETLPRRSLSSPVMLEVATESAGATAVEPKKPAAGSSPPKTKARLDPPDLSAGQRGVLIIPLPAGAAPGNDSDLEIVLLNSPMTLAGTPGFGTDAGVPVIKVGVELKSGEVNDGAKDFLGVVRQGGNVLTSFAATVNVRNSLLGLLLLAATAAFFALLTPCVFPMIPITVSFFTKQAEVTKRSPVSMGMLYGFGIVASFTGIGLLFTLILGGSGASQFALHGITQAFIGVLFLFFALSLFGAYDLQLPESFQNLAGRAQGSGGSLGVLALGLLFAITTFTCTAPFVGVILAGAAASEDYLRPALAMLVFSAVLATPFVLLSIFPSKLKKLPRSGGWLNEVKVCMGFIEVAAAFKFLGGMDQYYGWDVFTRSFVICAWAICFFAMGAYLLGMFRLPHDSPKEKVGVLALCIALLSGGFSLYLIRGLDGSPLHAEVDAYMPREIPSRRQETRDANLLRDLRKALGGAVGSSRGAPKIEGRRGLDQHFKNNYVDARAEARRLGMPIFINFTGHG